MVLVLAVAVILGACGRRSAASRAAESAQDACIGALAPVAADEVPPAAVLRAARDDAAAAAGVDRRWEPLLERVREAVAALDTPGFDPAVDALAAECGRVNDIVRRGGREPSGA